MHYSGAASTNCHRTGKQKSEQEQVAEALLYRGCCYAQDDAHTAASTRNLLALLVDRQEDGIVLIGPDQTVAWMNKAMEKLFGMSGYETIGMNAIEFISFCISPNLLDGEDLKEDFIVSCFFCENIPARQYCMSRAPARKARVEYSSTVIPAGPARGARLDTYHVNRDSDRAETSLQEYRQRYDLLEAFSSDLVISLDPGLKITSVSPSVKGLLGHNPDDLAGKHLSSIMARDSISEFQKACFLNCVSRGSAEASNPAGGVRGMETVLMNAQNQPVTVTFGFSPVDDGEGSLTGIIAVAHKKTDEHLWQEACSQLDRNTEQLACLGDRIRNPLAVIIGLADMHGGEVARKISEQALIIDEIVTELDREYVASLSVRQYLRKHYHLGDDAQLQAPSPTSGSADCTPCRSGSPTGT
jgi:PAS domain S-box-containing protein